MSESSEVPFSKATPYQWSPTLKQCQGRFPRFILGASESGHCHWTQDFSKKLPAAGVALGRAISLEERADRRRRKSMKTILPV